MPDRAKVDRLELAQFTHGAIGQNFARLKITVAAEIVVMPVEFEAEFAGGGFAYFERFARDFRAGAVPANDCNIVVVHEFSLPPSDSGEGSRDAMDSALAFNLKTNVRQLPELQISHGHLFSLRSDVS